MGKERRITHCPVSFSDRAHKLLVNDCQFSPVVPSSTPPLPSYLL